MTRTVLESSRCKRGCCWTPYACGLAYKCRCHRPPTGVRAARLRLEDFLDSLGDDE